MVTKPDIHDLDHMERCYLNCVNVTLTKLTERHDAACECELCRARMLTDVQDEASFHIPCVLSNDK